MHPAIVIFLIGAVISITMSFVNRKVLGSEKAKEVKKKMQDVRSKMLEAQKNGDTKTTNQCLAELMKINSEYMQFMIKPMIVSLILFLLITPVIKGNYTGKIVATIPQSLPVVGGIQLSWLWWYVISTFVVSIITKKILEI
jgi:uncharacterized membrane protein (DUF106 family)